MRMLFLEYPKCSTCQKAKKWLDEHQISYEDRHIVENNPTFEELKSWYERSGLSLKKFFNTSGMLYKEMKLKDKLPEMSEEEQLKLLATNGIRYDYFNLDDKNIFRDHEPLIAPAPHCTDGDHFYYREKKLSFTKQEDVYKRALQTAKKGRVFTFHWRGGYLTREILGELLELIRKAGKEKQKSARISLNWPQAVLCFDYVEDQGQPETEVTLEEANEGEME